MQGRDDQRIAIQEEVRKRQRSGMMALLQHRLGLFLTDQRRLVDIRLQPHDERLGARRLAEHKRLHAHLHAEWAHAGTRPERMSAPGPLQQFLPFVEVVAGQRRRSPNPRLKDREEPAPFRMSPVDLLPKRLHRLPRPRPLQLGQQRIMIRRRDRQPHARDRRGIPAGLNEPARPLASALAQHASDGRHISPVHPQGASLDDRRLTLPPQRLLHGGQQLFRSLQACDLLLGKCLQDIRLARGIMPRRDRRRGEVIHPRWRLLRIRLPPHERW